MKKTLILIGGLVLAGFVFGFVYWLAVVKPKTESPASPAAGGQKEDLCAEFPKTEGEITCQEAREVALAKYPGQILDIVQKEETLYSGKPPERQKRQETVWLVGILLDEPITPPQVPSPDGKSFLSPPPTNKIEAAVATVQKTILFYRPIK